MEIKVKCQICGIEKEHLVGHINSVHNLSKVDYLALYPEAKICSELFSSKKRNTQIGRVYDEITREKHSIACKTSLKFKQAMKMRNEKNPPRLGTKTSEQARENMRKGALGKVLSKDHKNHISEGVKKALQNDLNLYQKRVDQLLNLHGDTKYEHGRTLLLGKETHYRSSYELKGIKILNRFESEIVEFLNEKLHISYLSLDGKLKIHVPDWLITLKSGDKALIEVKPKGKLTDIFVILKCQAALDWTITNGVSYHIWTEDVLFNNCSTTMSLKEILEATITHQNDGRYSLNS